MEKPTEKDDVLYYANPDFIYREVAGENVLIPTGKASEKLYGIVSLNTSGTFLWGILAEKRTILDLTKMLAREYELSFDRSLQDVSAFLKLGTEKNVILKLDKEGHYESRI